MMIPKTKYHPVNNKKRHQLIQLIYGGEKLSIRQAALRINISYPTAKAINRIYKQENRVDKKKKRDRRETEDDVTTSSKLPDSELFSQKLQTTLSANDHLHHTQNAKNLADRIQALGMGQLRCLDLVNRDMSHVAGCDSPADMPNAQQDMHWAEKSTPLLGRRGKRNASPADDSDDEDGTLAILPPAFKRSHRNGAMRAWQKSSALSDLR